jgi:hypothetical protein
MDAHQTRTEVNNKRMMAELDDHHDRKMACLGEPEIMDLGANPEG